MKYSIIILSLSLTIFGGCNGFVSDVDGPKVDPKLVLFCVISPEMDTLEVRVNKSWPLDTPQPGMHGMYSPVENATVKLKSNEREAILNFNFRRQSFVVAASQFPIEPRKTYRLEVSAPGGFEAWAECTVPAVLPNALEVTQVDKYTSDGWFEGRALSLKLVDLQGLGHFYYVDLARRFWSSFPDGPTSGFETIGFETGEQYITDANKDGAFFLFRSFRFDFLPTRDTLVLYSALTDEHFFRYHQSVRFFSGESPFSEPTPIYTNVVGGLGVFAACRQRKVNFVVE
jgi:hypothetical protein